MTEPIALDTSVIVAGLLSWHEHHESARGALEEAMSRDTAAVLPAHALVETYAVLTRLPPPHRLRPSVAFALISSSFRADTRLSGLETEVWTVLEEAASRDVSGGGTYDALVLAEARSAGAGSILTFNPTDFDRAGPGGIAVRVPETGGAGEPG